MSCVQHLYQASSQASCTYISNGSSPSYEVEVRVVDEESDLREAIIMTRSSVVIIPLKVLKLLSIYHLNPLGFRVSSLILLS